ncbi:facilitated trehalose transporter Tret1-2 homolog [Nomia melanderi]|uniref:facilitated trehalose transporter Tret1-2 homolog n=1 Tax=Nomia melanderi TaxID=2448451 RepID=UPI003FCE9A10
MEKNVSKKEEPELRLHIRQLMTALCPLLGVFVAGLSSGYSAVLLPQLNSPTSRHNRTSTNFTSDSDITVSSIDEESWIASSTILLMTPGCWLSGFLMEKLGRKRSTSVLFPVSLIGWLTIGLSNNIACLLIGRLISGLSAGAFGPVTTVYISETSDPVLRGFLLGLITLTLSAGIFVVHFVGVWLHWRTTAHICTAFVFISWLTCFMSRESPTWLISKGSTDQALQSWVYLRGWGTLSEYQALQNSKNSRRTPAKRSVYSKLKRTLSSRRFLWPLGVLTVFFFTSQFSGFNVVVFYSVDMLMEVTGPEYAYLGTMIIDVIRLITCSVGCYLIRICNRRTLTLLSGCGTASSLFLLSLSLYLNICRPWWPGFLLVLYIVFLTIGLAPLPWILCGELFPRKFRGPGSGITSGLAFAFFFVVVKIAPAMFVALQPHGTFAIYGVITVLGTGFLYLTLPETKDKTLQEVESAFDRKSSEFDAENAEITTDENRRIKHAET